MKKVTAQLRRRRHRGSALVTALLFVLIMSILLMGVGTLTVSHQQRIDMDLAYAQAYDLAAAGVNYELRKISQSAASADQFPGSTYSAGPGTFRVYVTDRNDGTWSAGETLYVYSTGTSNGVSRTLKIPAKQLGGNPYLMYVLSEAEIDTPMRMTGNIGTNGPMTFPNAISSTNPLDGKIELNGPAATLVGTGYNVTANPNPISFRTTDQIALEKFPQGGIPWLKTNNDNARAVPPIVNAKVSNRNQTFIGPGNFYLEDFDISEDYTVTWDDRNGPINIWIGPYQGGGSHVHLGKAARFGNAPQTSLYLSSDSYVHIKQSMSFTGAVYAYNKDSKGKPIGKFGVDPKEDGKSPTFSGQVVATEVTNNTGGKSGNPTMTYIPGLITEGGDVYYGYDETAFSREINPR